MRVQPVFNTIVEHYGDRFSHDANKTMASLGRYLGSVLHAINDGKRAQRKAAIAAAAAAHAHAADGNDALAADVMALQSKPSHAITTSAKMRQRQKAVSARCMGAPQNRVALLTGRVCLRVHALSCVWCAQKLKSRRAQLQQLQHRIRGPAATLHLDGEQLLQRMCEADAWCFHSEEEDVADAALADGREAAAAVDGASSNSLPSYSKAQSTLTREHCFRSPLASQLLALLLSESDSEQRQLQQHSSRAGLHQVSAQQANTLLRCAELQELVQPDVLRAVVNSRRRALVHPAAPVQRRLFLSPPRSARGAAAARAPQLQDTSKARQQQQHAGSETETEDDDKLARGHEESALTQHRPSVSTRRSRHSARAPRASETCCSVQYWV